MERVTDFIYLGSKITVDGDCSREIKRLLLLGSNVMTNLDSVLKSRNITLSTKVYLVIPTFFFSQQLNDIKQGVTKMKQECGRAIRPGKCDRPMETQASLNT